MLNRKLRMGMVGGGPGAFIGEVHRKAARLDGNIEIVAGAFDIDPEKSKQMAATLKIDPKHRYSYQVMAEALEKVGQIDEAIKMLEIAKGFDPQAVETLTRLGRLLAQTGNMDGATQEFQAALAINPDHAPTLPKGTDAVPVQVVVDGRLVTMLITPPRVFRPNSVL